MMSNAAQAAEHTSYADKMYRRARKTARFAESQYQRAAEYRKHAAWLTRRGLVGEDYGTPAEWENIARIAERTANTSLESSLNGFASVAFYRDLARTYRARAAEDAKRVAEYRIAQDQGIFEHNHYGQEPVLRHKHDGGGRTHEHAAEVEQDDASRFYEVEAIHSRYPRVIGWMTDVEGEQTQVYESPAPSLHDALVSRLPAGGTCAYCDKPVTQQEDGRVTGCDDDDFCETADFHSAPVPASTDRIADELAAFAAIYANGDLGRLAEVTRVIEGVLA